MKSFIVFALIAAVAADVSHLQQYASSGAEAAAQVVVAEADVRPDGYSQRYETSNGIAAQEQGQLKNQGREGEAIEAQGSFQYYAPDGTPIQVSYIANEYGFQPQGSHLPTPPPPQPIPDYIQRSLEYIRAHPSPQESQPQNQYAQNRFARRN
ncbi:hypothetical protein O0L34_g7443 [Tuta absoluta]|nr:hypothetical protein O0L34_g7443 [Tuta absoluta]